MDQPYNFVLDSIRAVLFGENVYFKNCVPDPPGHGAGVVGHCTSLSLVVGVSPSLIRWPYLIAGAEAPPRQHRGGASAGIAITSDPPSRIW